ncbi:alpha-2-macroglobulin family protein [Mesobaculum littorinae]|uniref:Alpha-2-macroglobulin family protein n=1 Tax=Mesobaculum littorinae TaxID=2486419 RepID=A0A438AHQ8_9RHOB|nr:alpha-2-macroglobulin family protein [Mesobaculum littorinae]RVV98155.1 alpha-2-macroglobulin family protein [Mesobaculum littorinae]
MRRIVNAIVLALATGAPALAQTPEADPAAPIPERRLIVSQDTDFYGGDLRALFDTTLEACITACTGDADCRAFTYNATKGSCFPKSSVLDRTAFVGATSAEVVDRPSGDLALARTRADALSFLRPADFDAARNEARALPLRHAADGRLAVDLIQQARRERDRGNIIAAMDLTGAALGETDAAELWVDYARLALAARTNDQSRDEDLRDRGLAAAINGYLRARAVPVQVEALSTMAMALERGERGRDTIPALRLAQSLTPDAEDPDLAARLDEAVAQFGFRITDHQIDSDSEAPRICAQFSEPLAQAGTDYAPFVQADAAGLAVEPQGDQLCLSGVEHGTRYHVTFREGLLAASGEVLAASVPLDLYVRDRAPGVRFPGRGYILPAGGEVAVPVVTVNLDEVALELRQVSDRNLIRAMQQNLFAGQVPEYDRETFESELSREVWTGTGAVARDLNRDVTTRLPLGEVAGDLSAGIYVLFARIPGADPWETPAAAQWFVVSDLGMTTLSGNDGLHVFVRSLDTAAPVGDVTLTLLSRANAVLGKVQSDGQGHAAFAPGLARGTGPEAPAMVLAETGGDMAFLPLTDPEFDLSDRGVAGRPAAGPVDVFLATDRGVYRAGDTINATVLARDAGARSLPGLPLTAILTRPDGVEYARRVSSGADAGGHVFALATTDAVPRGTWRLDIHADPEAEPLASTPLLVEDFLPERIDADLSLPEGPLRPGTRPDLLVEARYLFGAPAAGLPVEAEVRLAPAEGLEGRPGYVFGRHDAAADPVTQYLDAAETGPDGTAILPLTLPEIGPETGSGMEGRPIEARVLVRLREGSGRPIERMLTRPVAPDGPMIGLRPLVEGVVPEGGEAAFQAIAVVPGQAAPEMPARWTLNRVETRYQWFRMYGDWQWEPVTRRERVASGEVTLGDTPVRIAAQVDWGEYELRIEAADGSATETSTAFTAGWYAMGDTVSTPDMLEASLDAEAYAPGDTATLRIVPRFAGKALITVMSDHLIDMKAVDVPEGESLIELPVTDDWGPGAYVAASVLRPADRAAGQGPARALGLGYATVDPGDRALAARLEVPDEIRPRGPLDVTLAVDGVAEGETAWATIAAVDVGILNVTGFEPPDPSDHYFGQRELGVGIRDVYGRLIDGMSGEMGRLRSGGDAGGALQMQSPPPSEDLVALFHGPVEIGADGTARVSFDIPGFDGTLRLMAVVWSARGVGEAQADVLVRDPVVVSATLPRFLAPGDTSQMLLEVTHVGGPAGRVEIGAAAPEGLLPPRALPTAFSLEAGGIRRIAVPLTAPDAPGDYTIALTATLPGGEEVTRSLRLPVRANDPEITRTSRFDLAPGASFTLDDEVFAGLRPGTGTATLTAGPLARFDAPGLLEALDRYPYGCTEQVTSQGMPLLYLSSVAQALDRAAPRDIDAKLDRAVALILTNQASSGSFGLWRPDSGDFWLDAYATDFLSRARAQGVAVPDTAFRLALDNLRNRVNYAPDFEEGGEDIAYALYVLAREGEAAVGDLRYYADTKAADFATPLALAQLGAALAFRGDPARADAMFAAADARLAALPQAADPGLWRGDYGTPLRDRAAVLALAAEAGSEAVDRPRLIDAVAQAPGAPRSTQEAAWSLMAVAALPGAVGAADLRVDGQAATGPLVRRRSSGSDAAPVEVANTGGDTAELTLTTFGVPDIAPEAMGEGYDIERRSFTLDGTPATLDDVAVGTRLVTLLTVQPWAPVEARLIVDDPLPAGFEIDNPNLLRSGDVRALDWLDALEDVAATEFRSDRFVAAVDWRSGDTFRLAYIIRAVSPGSYRHPAAKVEDMYRPRYRAITGTGRASVVEGAE